MTINEEVQQIRHWRDQHFSAISKIESETYQRILMTACIDAFVQHHDMIYTMRKQRKKVSDRQAFSDFLQKYVNDEQRKKWLRLVCPTTVADE